MTVNESRKRLQVVAKFQRKFNLVCKGQYNCIFPLKILFHFSPFPGGMKNTCIQFSHKLFDLFEFFTDYDEGTRIYKKVCCMNGCCQAT